MAVITADGRPAPVGEIGEIAVRSPDPVMFLRYWNNPEATAEKFAGEWLPHRRPRRDGRGRRPVFRARTDDLINSAGYRIGPGEIEDCLLKHAAVAMAAVIGVPDELRGEAVKAYVQLAPDAVPSDALVAELQALARTRLSAHEYPRHVEFVGSLPLTTTGKVRRRELRERALAGEDHGNQ